MTLHKKYDSDIFQCSECTISYPKVRHTIQTRTNSPKLYKHWSGDVNGSQQISPNVFV